MRQRPTQTCVMRQTWAHLLFLHWRFPVALVQRTLPLGLTVDAFEGAAWLGVVPFFMRKVRPRGLPGIPGLLDFLELNVRTYVHDEAGRPGVWFYSLDCNQSLAVRMARALFHLPYEHATMSANTREDGTIEYDARRRGQGSEARFVYPTPARGTEVELGSLEFFLIERYALFAHAPRSGQLFSGRVFHRPYQVSSLSVPTWSDLPLRQAGFDSDGRPPDHQCAAAPVDVEIFGLKRVV